MMLSERSIVDFSDLIVKDPKKLSKAAKLYVDPERPKIDKLRRLLKVRLLAVLKAAAKSVSAQVKTRVKELGKADTRKDEADKILAALNLEIFETLQDDIEAGLHDVYSDAGRAALAQLGSRVGDDLVNQVSERSLIWAREHAADLVGVSDDERYSLPDATRDMLRATIADGIEENLSAEEIADAIEEGYAFSEERADLIAMTEINSANSMGALAGYEEAKDAGVKLGKSWLVLEDGCPICQDNADEGVIELDEEFPSGDLAPPGHPNCRCVLVPEVEDEEGNVTEGEPEEGDDLEQMAKGDWNEDDHPRGSDGKFGDGGGAIPGPDTSSLSGKSEDMANYFPVLDLRTDVDPSEEKAQKEFNVFRAWYNDHDNTNPKDLPVQKVPLDKVIARQNFLNYDKVNQYVAKEQAGRGEKGSRPVAWKFRGDYYLVDGHHRTVAALQSGRSEMSMRVKDLSHMDKMENPALPTWMRDKLAKSDGDEDRKLREAWEKFSAYKSEDSVDEEEPVDETDTSDE